MIRKFQLGSMSYFQDFVYQKDFDIQKNIFSCHNFYSFTYTQKKYKILLFSYFSKFWPKINKKKHGLTPLQFSKFWPKIQNENGLTPLLFSKYEGQNYKFLNEFFFMIFLLCSVSNLHSVFHNFSSHITVKI